MAEQYELSRSEVIRNSSIKLMISAVMSSFPGLPNEHEISKSIVFIPLSGQFQGVLQLKLYLLDSNVFKGPSWP